MNSSYPLSTADEGQNLFVATQNGPIQRSDNGAPIRNGLVVINSTTALTLTLAAPRPGPQVQGGDDGSVLQIVVAAATPFAPANWVTHTITSTFASGLTTAKIVGLQGETMTLLAYNGMWLLLAGTGGPVS